MATLPAKPAMKDRILETADRLFYLQGIRAVGVDTIAAEIGISKRTLYNHFPSKDALISAYLSRRFVAPRASDKSPVEQILGTFDSLERRFSSKDFRGCPFVNAVAELAARSTGTVSVSMAAMTPKHQGASLARSVRFWANTKNQRVGGTLAVPPNGAHNELHHGTAFRDASRQDR